MKASEWKTYRTRFLVKAKKLNSNLSFTDSLGREHCGRKGDYLVEFSDGAVRIAPRHFFEDVYVPMAISEDEATTDNRPTTHDRAVFIFEQAAVVRRKQPQPCQAASPRVGMM